MGDVLTGPPATLDEPLSLNPQQWDPKQIYYLHAALIIPRPIAWVSTLSADGIENLAPHSYFNGIADDPPYLMFAIEGESDTYCNLVDVPEFVVNMVTVDLAEAMELTAVAMPPDESEFDWARLERAPSRVVRPERVRSAKAAMECKVDQIVKVGNRNHMVIGEVVQYHVSPDIWRNGRVDPVLYRPLCRLGARYAELGTIFKIARPTFEDVAAAGPDEALGIVSRELDSDT